jgi:DNA processing protein
MNPAAELADWLRLLGTEGVGRETARRLLAAFGSASQVFESEGAARRALVTEAQAQSLERRPAG